MYIFKGINSDTIGYYLPNQKILEENLENYILDVDTIGERTGIKFN
jgi:hypothetical protein